MTKHEIMIIADYAQENWLSLTEVATICHLSDDLIQQYIRHEIIVPRQLNESEWVVDLTQLKRMKTASRLVRDLEINLAGAALVLDLLDQIDELREHKALLERHVLR